jgi:hypothetical protein
MVYHSKFDQIQEVCLGFEIRKQSFSKGQKYKRNQN